MSSLAYPLLLLCPLSRLDTYSASNASAVDALLRPARDTSITTNAVDAEGKEVSSKETKTETEARAEAGDVVRTCLRDRMQASIQIWWAPACQAPTRRMGRRSPQPGCQPSWDRTKFGPWHYSAASCDHTVVIFNSSAIPLQLSCDLTSLSLPNRYPDMTTLGLVLSLASAPLAGKTWSSCPSTGCY